MNQYQQPYVQQPYAAQPGDPMAYIAALEQRIYALEMRLPNTSLVAPGFMKRAFAVWGHMFVSSFIIGMIFSVLGAIVSVIAGAGLASLINSSGGF